jgi:hypothetical protein
MDKFAKLTADFKATLKQYRANPSKQLWDKLWIYIYNCCSAQAKIRAKGINITDLDDTIMNATIYSMCLIKRGSNPEYLPTWCAFNITKYLYDPKKKREDRHLDVDPILKKMDEYSDESEWQFDEFYKTNTIEEIDDAEY